MVKHIIKRLFLYILCNNTTYCQNKNNDEITQDLSVEETTSSTKNIRKISNAIGKFFNLFYNFDLMIRTTRLESVYPFYFGKDGSLTLRISFLEIFKHNYLLKHRLIFEFNAFKVKDLGGRGINFMKRKLGNNIMLSNWDEDNNSKKFADGSYFFSLLDKTVFLFSVGIEGNGIYNKLFKTNFIRSGIGLRIPIWCDGPFTLVKNLELDYENINYNKDKGCAKWEKLNKKSPVEGFLFNVTLYVKPFIYEFDNGFRIELTIENCINDFKYVKYKIKRNYNNEKRTNVYNFADKFKHVNCFRKFLIIIENLFILKTKVEIGFNLTKLI